MCKHFCVCVCVTVSPRSVTPQQLAGSLWLEVVDDDVLAVAAVQHFLVPVFYHLPKHAAACVSVCVTHRHNSMRGTETHTHHEGLSTVSSRISAS